jgi:Uma2 family endonuclease
MTTLSAPVPLPPPILMTAEEFTARYAEIHAELVKGIVVEYPAPFVKHGIICTQIGCFVYEHVAAYDLGRVASNDTWIKTGSNPDTVRCADVCFFSYDRLPKGEVPDGLLPTAPDLVVEVRSPADRWTTMLARIVDYLRAGVRVVVVLDPTKPAAAVYRDDQLLQIFHNGDELTLPDVLPGFAVPVNRLFT